MLLHEHGQAVNNEKYGMRPWPLAVNRPADGCGQVECLPDLNNKVNMYFCLPTRRPQVVLRKFDCVSVTESLNLRYGMMIKMLDMRKRCIICGPLNRGMEFNVP